MNNAEYAFIWNDQWQNTRTFPKLELLVYGSVDCYIGLKCDDIHTCLVYGRSCLEFEKLRKKIFAKDMEWKENGEHNFSRDSAGERLEQETPVYVSYRS